MVQKCIAIINHESAVVHLLDDLLREAGYETTTWTGSMDAHEMVRREQPNLVILDIAIDAPTSGMVLLDLLKLDFATRDIPVIVCSTNVAMLGELNGRLRELGCIIQPKPYRFEQLLAAIEEALTPGEDRPG